MKILLVLDSFYPNVDGPVEVIVNLAKSYIQTGCEAELLVPAYPKNIEIEGLKIHRCKSVKSNEGYRMATPAVDGKIKKLIKTGGFDIVHLHSPFTLARYAQKIAHKLGIPVVMTVHTKFRDELEKRLKSRLLVKLVMNYILASINGSDDITTVSYGALDTLKEYGCVRCTQVIRNATSMPSVRKPDNIGAAKLRSELGIEDKFAFLFVGRLAQVKNIQFNMRTLAVLKARGLDNFKFIIVGDGNYGNALKKMADDLSISDKVVFAGKVLDRRALSDYYAACDLLLFPSLFDTAGIVVTEAAAHCVATVAVEGSCAAEVITSGVNGLALKDDVNVWADALETYIANPDAAKQLGENALRDIYCGWDEKAAEYLEVYKSLINKNSNRS